MSEKRKTFNITFNKGIDKASAPFEADPSRALEAMNYVYRDGKVQKRYGITNLINIEPTQYVVVDFVYDSIGTTIKENTLRFNGLWSFVAEDGQRHLVAHIGKLLYEILESGGDFIAQPIRAKSGLYNSVAFKCYEFEDYKSSAVIGNNALYFLGGNKLMKLRFLPNSAISFKPVDNDLDTYIPTTTISVTYKNAVKSGRASLDEVNLMTQWRKNRLLSGVGVDENAPDAVDTKYFVYQLDAPIVGRRAVDDIKKIRIKITRRK